MSNLRSTISLCDLLDFLLLPQGEAGLLVALLAVDDLVGQALGDGLVGPHGLVAGSAGQQVDGLVNPPQGGHVHGLLPHGTSTADTGGVFPGAGNLDGVDEDLEGVPAGEEVDDLEGVPDDADGLDLLAGVAAVELHGADESLDDGAEGLPELLGLVATGGVGDIDLGLGGLAGDVVDEARVLDFDVIIRPLGEQLGGVLELGLAGAFGDELDVLLHVVRNIRIIFYNKTTINNPTYFHKGQSSPNRHIKDCRVLWSFCLAKTSQSIH